MDIIHFICKIRSVLNKGDYMKILLSICSVLLSVNVLAKVDCTSEPRSKWKDEAAFKKELSASYKIKVFKVTKGNCYEIYGWNKEGKKVEIYFNPVTGEKVKEKIQ